MKFIFMLAVILMPFSLYPCPITITNDLDQTVLIVDPKGTQALYLKQNASGVIDPTISPPFMRYILDEKLDIYYASDDMPQNFYKRYQLIEKYCTDNEEENQLTVQQILQFEKSPTDRFKLKKIEQVEDQHVHDHH